MKIMMRLCRNALTYLNQRYKPFICYYSEKIVPLNETTLIGRILLFMDNAYYKTVSATKNEKFKNYSCTENIIDKLKLNQVDLEFEQLEELLYRLKHDGYVSNVQYFQKLINMMDLECCSKLKYLDTCSILRLLNAFTQSIPNRITEIKYYTNALEHLSNYIDYLSKEELLQTMFYVGLQKKTKYAQMMLRNCLRRFSKNDISRLSIEELCIICNSTFKASAKISNKEILKKIRQTINNNLYLLNDAALLITLLKTIRHNKYQDDNLLNTMTCTIFFNKTYKNYNFPALCHILATYADYQFYDEEICKLFVHTAIGQLKESCITNEQLFVVEKIRPKDITRFLWAISKLGYRVNIHLYKNVIVPKIIEGIEVGAYTNETEELINSCLYLWISNYQALELIPYTLTKTNMNIINDTKSKTKSRLNLLLTCIFFENKRLLQKLNLKAQRSQVFNTQLQLEQRPCLVRILTLLRQLSEGTCLNKFEVTYEVPHLNICGITGFTKSIHKTAYIEVLDDYVCVRYHQNRLIGPMQLKLRILKEKDEALITIPNNIIEKSDQESLEEYLKSEIELLC